MSEFKVVILQLSVVSVILVIIDAILPSNKLKTFISSFVGLVAVCMLINPLLSFFKIDNINDFAETETYFNNYYMQKHESTEALIEAEIESAFSVDAEVELILSEEGKVVGAKVRLGNMTSKDAIKTYIAKKFSINESEVEIYE